MRVRLSLGALLVLVVGAVAVGCGGGASGAGPTGEQRTLFIGGIPDQNNATLERQFGLLADYLSGALGREVRYRPSTDYAAIVTAFARGDVDLGWFGGLTGVQARDRSDGARALAQRPRDAEFHSVFIVRADLPVASLADLRGLSFTFGSESSTSGHLMPRFYLQEAGIDPDEDFAGVPNYSGSHDQTYKLVEAGAFQAGALNEAVWADAVDDGSVDTERVRVFWTTPPYYDYHFVVRADVDVRFGDGTADAILAALLALSPDDGADAAELLDLFQTDRFVVTQDANYDAIRSVARTLGILPEG